MLPSLTIQRIFLSVQQVHGADVPLYERSQLSTTAIFQTLPPNHAVSTSAGNDAVVVKSKGTSDGSSGVGKHTKAIATSKSMSNIPAKTSTKLSAASNTSKTNTDNTDTPPPSTNTNTNSNTSTTMSRTKKEIVSAVISGQQLIQIERLNNYCQSHGVSDNYM